MIPKPEQIGACFSLPDLVCQYLPENDNTANDTVRLRRHHLTTSAARYDMLLRGRCPPETLQLAVSEWEELENHVDGERLQQIQWTEARETAARVSLYQYAWNGIHGTEMQRETFEERFIEIGTSEIEHLLEKGANWQEWYVWTHLMALYEPLPDRMAHSSTKKNGGADELSLAEGATPKVKRYRKTKEVMCTPEREPKGPSPEL